MSVIESPAQQVNNPGLEALLNKLQPLLDGGRLDNLVDLASLLSDLVDLLDAPLVEKLSTQFEEATALSWNLGNAIRQAKAQTREQPTPPSLIGLLALLRDPNTRQGCALVLRVLNALGKQS